MSEAASSFSYNTVQPYSPPEWAQSIRYKPTSFVKVTYMYVVYNAGAGRTK